MSQSSRETRRGLILPARWSGLHSEIAQHVKEQSRKCLEAYRVHSTLVEEHANMEMATAQGGYERRQIYELVQNGADAMIEQPGKRIHVLLTEDALYCANEGEPIDADGVRALLSAHLWVKRGREIGRFGLGFKSVLGVTDHPEFYSESGSFRFDAAWAERQIRAVVPDAERVPVLRIAVPVDPKEAAEQDPILASLMAWAVTVVKLPLRPDGARWLPNDLTEFPAEFLIFSPHVGELELENRRTGFSRRIRLAQDGDRVQLVEPGNVSKWKLFSTQHKPSEKARADAGELADRDELPIAWAVQLSGASRRGRFWAFFPTEYETTLSGILNAPWKTNEDRQNLLRCDFTCELLEAAADLVVRSLPALVDADDPGAFLELMPARGGEAPQWADRQLTELVYARAAHVQSLPDQTGALRLPSDMTLHPDKVPRAILNAWTKAPGRPRDWCHPSVENVLRRSRAERLIELGEGTIADVPSWLTALVDPASPETSADALILAASLYESTPGLLALIQSSKIVLTEDGQLVCPKPGTVFLSSGYDSVSPGAKLVHPEVEENPDALRALEQLGIRGADAASELQSFAESLHRGDLTPDWSRFWAIARRVDPEQVVDVMRRQDVGHLIHAKVIAGEFLPLSSTLLPGRIVPGNASRDAAVTVDLEFHRADVEVLKRLGAVAEPVTEQECLHSKWYESYRDAAIDTLLAELPRGSSTPQQQLLRVRKDGWRGSFAPSPKSAGPLDPLFELSDEGRALFVDALLDIMPEEIEWEIYHSTQRQSYPVVKVPSPEVWAIRKAGRLHTSLGLRSTGEAVGPEMEEWRQVLPVAKCAARVARLLGLPADAKELAAKHWVAALNETLELRDDQLLGRFCGLAAEYQAAPYVVRCRVGDDYDNRPPGEVAVVCERSQFEALRLTDIPAILAPTEAAAELLVQEWGLVRPAVAAKPDVEYSASGPEVQVADKFPGLRHRITAEQRELRLVPCSSVRLVALSDRGRKTEEKEFLPFGDAVFHSDELAEDSLLNRLVELFRLDLGDSQKQDILDYGRRQRQLARQVKVREAADPEDKLLAAVGSEAIRRHLPESLLEAAEARFGPPSGRRLAEFALAVYGVEVLRAMRDELEAAGFDPPGTWAGTAPARDFVRELGFPKEFAGFEHARRDKLLEVEGPPELPPLHDFQEKIAERMLRMAVTDKPTRALLSLPTGAGKTRVAVESLVRAIRRNALVGPVLWVAQTDELCEQAVQTWSEVWRDLGPPRERLYISRLWAANEAESIDAGPQIVVASIQKLQPLIDDPKYDWLKTTQFVVFDEAHRSTEPSYTAVINWIVRDGKSDRCLVVGLTATAFRANEKETKRLVGRYGGTRLDDGVLGDDPYTELQQAGVVARVEQRLLRGADLELGHDELASLKEFSVLPASAADRLGADIARNQMLVDDIKSLSSDWPVLLFATSVDHAKIMAALLRVEGITAAAISGDTDMGARRHYIDEFRQGRCRVLTNYQVLTAGFDAPSIRALYVARPTYSPVIYQQMIGRGLRGPLNGGKDTCMIVNVEDNIHEYSVELAFREFEYLWSKTEVN